MSYQTDLQAHTTRLAGAINRQDWAAKDAEARHWEEMEQLRRLEEPAGSDGGGLILLLALGLVFVLLFLAGRGIFRLGRRVYRRHQTSQQLVVV
jgi:hypothetical protein